FFILPPPPTSTLFPYTTLFRSNLCQTGNPLPTHHGTFPLDRSHDLPSVLQPPCVESQRPIQVSRQRRFSCRRDLTMPRARQAASDRKSTRLNSSHEWISYAVFC